MTRSGLRTVRPQAGFTLMELLLATAISAVVLVVVQTTYFGALRLHNTTHARIDEDRVVQRALAILRRDLSGLMLPGGTFGGQLQSTTLSATSTVSYGERVTPDLYTTTGKVDGWSPFAEVQRVAYYLAPSTERADARDLVRVVTRNLLPVQEDDMEPQVLLRDVAAATIEFYDGYGWTDLWDSEATSSLPTGIRFSLTRGTGPAATATEPPIELVVPVLVTTRTQAQAAAGEVAP